MERKMRFFDDEYWKCRDHPDPDTNGPSFYTFYESASGPGDTGSDIEEYCRDVLRSGQCPEGMKDLHDIENWLIGNNWDYFSSMYPGIELDGEEKRLLLLNCLPDRVKKDVEAEDRRCRALVAERESEFMAVLEKMKAADPELYAHFANDDYYDVPAAVRSKGDDVIIDLAGSVPGQLRKMVFKDARIDEGEPPSEFYIDMVEWYAEGDERSVYFDVVQPGHPRTWFSVVFRSARFIGS